MPLYGIPEGEALGRRYGVGGMLREQYGAHAGAASSALGQMGQQLQAARGEAAAQATAGAANAASPFLAQREAQRGYVQQASAIRGAAQEQLGQFAIAETQRREQEARRREQEARGLLGGLLSTGGAVLGTVVAPGIGGGIGGGLGSAVGGMVGGGGQPAPAAPQAVAQQSLAQPGGGMLPPGGGGHATSTLGQPYASPLGALGLDPRRRLSQPAWR